MRKELKALLTVVATVIASVVLVDPAFGQEGEARVRVAHLSPDASIMEVHVNGEPASSLSGMGFKTISPYITLPDGQQSFEFFTVGDTSEAVARADLDLRGGEAYTIAVVGLAEDGSLKTQVYEDDLSAPAEDSARLRVVHAAPDVESVDIAPSGGEDLFTDLGFPNASEYAEVPAGTYALEATLTGSERVAFRISRAALAADTVYTAFAVGLGADSTFEIVIAEDSAAPGARPPTADLPVVQDEALSSKVEVSMPETGGLPVALLLLPLAILAVASALLARRWRD